MDFSSTKTNFNLQEIGVLSSSSSSSESDSSGSDSGSDSDDSTDDEQPTSAAAATLQQNLMMNQLPNLGMAPVATSPADSMYNSQSSQPHHLSNNSLNQFGSNGAFHDDLLHNDLQLSSNSSDDDE